jgi:hypothetical protein
MREELKVTYLFLGIKRLYYLTVRIQVPCLNPQCMAPFTAAKFETQLVAIVQTQVTTNKHFKGFHLHIEFTGPGGADARKTLFPDGRSVIFPNIFVSTCENSILPYF